MTEKQVSNRLTELRKKEDILLLMLEKHLELERIQFLDTKPVKESLSLKLGKN